MPKSVTARSRKRGSDLTSTDLTSTELTNTVPTSTGVDELIQRGRGQGHISLP